MQVGEGSIIRSFGGDGPDEVHRQGIADIEDLNQVLEVFGYIKTRLLLVHNRLDRATTCGRVTDHLRISAQLNHYNLPIAQARYIGDIVALDRDPGRIFSSRYARQTRI